MFFLRKHSVSIKMLIAPAVLISVLLLFGVYTTTIISNQKKNNIIIKESINKINFISSLHSNLILINEECHKFIGWSSSGYSETRLDSIKQLTDKLIGQTLDETNKFLAQSAKDDSITPVLQELADSVVSYKSWTSKMFEIASTDLSVASTFMKPADDILTQKMQQLKLVLDNHRSKTNKILKNSDQQNQKVFTGFIIFFIIALSIGLFVSLIVARSVIIPLRNLMKVINQAVTKDLSVTIENTSEDETGDISKSLKSLIQELWAIVSLLNKKSEHIASVGKNLQTVSISLSQKAGDISSESKDVMSETEQSVSTITTINAETEHISSSIHSMSSAIEEMSVSLKDVASFCQHELDIASDAVKQSTNAQNLLTHLNASSKEIGNAIVLIKKIADKTNLLALNASIEASSAGDFGRGFAIVASEVKELSKQTADTVDIITRQVSSMQTAAQQSTRSIDSIHNVIKEVHSTSTRISEVVSQQSTTINDIARTVSEINQNSSRIAGMTKESTGGFRTVAQKVASVDVSISETSRNIKLIESSSTELKQLADEIVTIVTKFKL